MVFPASLETYATAVDNTTDVMAADVNLLRRTVEKLQIKMGIDSSGVASSHDYMHFPSTTTMVFGDDTAPQGWTRKADWQDGAMFVYASAGNLAAGGAASSFATHTHTGPDHNHQWYNSVGATGDDQVYNSGGSGVTIPNNDLTKSSGWEVGLWAASGGQGLLDSYTDLDGTGNTGNNSAVPYYQELLAATKD